jgi:hypothetical protein
MESFLRAPPYLLAQRIWNSRSLPSCSSRIEPKPLSYHWRPPPTLIRSNSSKILDVEGQHRWSPVSGTLQLIVYCTCPITSHTPPSVLTPRHLHQTRRRLPSRTPYSPSPYRHQKGSRASSISASAFSVSGVHRHRTGRRVCYATSRGLRLNG